MYHHHKISQGSPAWGLPRLLWPWKAGLPETQVGDLSCWRNFRLPSTALTCLDRQLQNQVVLCDSFTTFTFQIRQHLNLNTNQCLQAICSQLNSQVPSHVEQGLDYQGSASPLRSCAERFTATAPLSRTPAPPRQIAMTKIRRNDILIWLCVGSIGFPHVPTRAFSSEDPSKCEKTSLAAWPRGLPQIGDGPQVYKARFIEWFIMFLWFMRCRMMPRKSAIIRYPCWSMWLRSRIVGVPCRRQLRDKLPCFFNSSNKHQSLASRLDQIRVHICQCNGAGDKSPRTVARTSLLPKWASKSGKTCRKSCKNWKSGSALNEEKQGDQPPCLRFLLLVALTMSHHVAGAKWIQIVQQ